MSTSDQDRRTFFRTAGRTTVLGTMGMLGLLIFGRERNTPGRQVCINRSVCCTCHVFGECELPAARSAKQAKGASRHEERLSGTLRPTRQIRRPVGRILRMSRTAESDGKQGMEGRG